jgi:hypothetical protein
MALEYEIISRGVYRHGQIENFILIGQYAFIRKSNKKYLALRFENELDTDIHSMSFTLIQLNSSGDVIERTHISYGEISVKAHTEFAHESVIRVRSDCSDFEIAFGEVRSSDLIYTVQGGRAVAKYNRIDPILDKVDEVQASRIPPLPKKHRHIMRFVAFIAVLAIACGNLFYLIGMISKENERRREESLNKYQNYQKYEE